MTVPEWMGSGSVITDPIWRQSADRLETVIKEHDAMVASLAEVKPLPWAFLGISRAVHYFCVLVPRACADGSVPLVVQEVTRRTPGIGGGRESCGGGGNVRQLLQKLHYGGPNFARSYRCFWQVQC
jgi:hypothetical protein